MCQDEIITEVWRIRDDYAAEKHHDLKEIVADLQRREQQTGIKVVDRRLVRGVRAASHTGSQD